MKKNTIIQIQNLDYYYGKSIILQNIDLEVVAGEIVTIIGPNGSGKTSLLRILAGIIKVKQGSYIKKKDLVISYMPQNLKFDPVLPLTIKSFLSLGNASKQEIDKVMTDLDMTHLLQKQVYEISGGELQRVLLANCLLTKPDVMILDEPVSNMDIKSTTSFYNLISKVRQSINCSIVMASHDLYVVMKKTDRIICLNNKVCCQGKPSDICTHKEFLNLFGQSIAVYDHHHSQ